MTKIEEELLNNILDALDRLNDRDIGVVDIYALLFATAHALSKSEFLPQVEEPIADLYRIMRSGSDKDEQYDAALVATNDLRWFIANLV